MSYSIIGGADGPTSVFIAGQIGCGWFNTYGLIFLILLLIPNIIYDRIKENIVFLDGKDRI